MSSDGIKQKIRELAQITNEIVNLRERIKLLNRKSKQIEAYVVANWEKLEHSSDNAMIAINSSQSKNDSNLDSICCICLNDITKRTNKIVTRCNHNFCMECLNKWLQNNSTCPMCRLIICTK